MLNSAEQGALFNVHFSVDASRGLVESLSYEVGYLHDGVAIQELTRLIEEAGKIEGKHEVLLLVGPCHHQESYTSFKIFRKCSIVAK